MISLADRLQVICEAARPALPAALLPEVDAALARLRGPLRLAIAGRVKAGKSTLLNALLGERLAATDAGERTRFVTWYEYGEGYHVFAEMDSGEQRSLRFEREDDELVIDDSQLPETGVRRLVVRWPTARLRKFTLIDTPGLGSASAVQRTIAGRMLEPGGGGLRAADAVIYLMRHAHRSDVAFLESFRDPSLADASPVNALAVLSRADEIGGGRPDAMESGHRIAQRYLQDPALKGLTGAVLPVCGLLAETAATLREAEYEMLVALAGSPDVMPRLLSADRFRGWDDAPLLPASREHLLNRLGMFGLRFAIAAIQAGEGGNSLKLARLLLECSGVPALDRVIERQFSARASRLIGYSVLQELVAAASREAAFSPAARAFLAALEEAGASSHDVDEIRVLHLATTGENRFTPAETAEIERITAGQDAAERLGPVAAHEDLRTAAINRATAWRSRVADPLNDPIQDYSCEVLTRSYETIAADLASQGLDATQ